MSLLTSFVSFLNEDERKNFAGLPLSGKEKLLRDVHLHPDKNGISKRDLLKQLNLSSSHFDKISTLVLKKAYVRFAGEEKLSQLKRITNNSGNPDFIY